MTDDLAIGTRSARASDRTWVDAISILACRIVWAVVVIGAPGWQRCLCHYSSYVKDVISSLELVYVMDEQSTDFKFRFVFFHLQMLRFSALCGPNEQNFGELLT